MSDQPRHQKAGRCLKSKSHVSSDWKQINVPLPQPSVQHSIMFAQLSLWKGPFISKEQSKPGCSTIRPKAASCKVQKEEISGVQPDGYPNPHHVTKIKEARLLLGRPWRTEHWTKQAVNHNTRVTDFL